eukprot:TRINITY_DN10385_c0_g1_i1.p1 TRINITY_DN10385_c0_g1~~TRINITY_DN10385_c0_g1_i1.p1  ORF type:complete len:175 (-),score=32.89 TRINITY_DN10385_c0_g1_i1:122-646(-)
MGRQSTGPLKQARDLMQCIFKLALQNKWGKYILWMALSFYALIGTKALPDSPQFIISGFPLLLKMCYLEDVEVVLHALSILIDLQSILELNGNDMTEMNILSYSREDIFTLLGSFVLGKLKLILLIMMQSVDQYWELVGLVDWWSGFCGDNCVQEPLEPVEGCVKPLDRLRTPR